MTPDTRAASSVPENVPRRLNIGCGDRPTVGWVNYDNSLSVLLGHLPLVGAILARIGLIAKSQLNFARIAQASGVRYANVTQKIPEADSSVDLIYSCHMLEHLTRSDALRFLRESRRVLKPGGALRIVVPDLKILVNNYQRGGKADDFMESLYIVPTDPDRLLNRLKCLLVGGRLHLWMYDADSLRELMTKAGFASVVTLPPGETTIKELEGIDLSERAEESLYVEGIKS
ncbi:MAG: hypothetical protein RIR86_1066 [Acidobacteriota bacterium]|jgi:SAM-dependent methyltransferase